MRARAFDTLESLCVKDLLPTQEKIRWARSGRGDRPAFDSESALAARQGDCCGDQRMGDATAAMLGVDEQTGDQPHQVVSSRGRARSNRLRPLMAAVYRDLGPQAHQPTGALSTNASAPIGYPLAAASSANRRRLPSPNQPAAN